MEKENMINLDKEIPIVNPKQAAYYWSKGIKPISIYQSIDTHSNDPIIVFVFNRNDTYSLYKEWLNRR